MPEGMIKARKRLLADEPSPPSHYIDVVNAAWETSKFPGIEHKVLYTDPNTGMATLLFRLAPGAVVAPEVVVVDRIQVLVDGDYAGAGGV